MFAWQLSLEITTASDSTSAELSFLTSQPFHIVIQVDSLCNTSILSPTDEEMEVAEKVGAGKKGLAEKSLGFVTGVRQWKPIYCSEVT